VKPALLAQAVERATQHVLRTPVVEVGGAHLKLECLQPTGSFKVRGFFAAALSLDADELRRGLLTVSAGNAAQACAYVARRLGVGCRVVMYDSAPAVKAEGVRRLGGVVVPMPRPELLAWMSRRGWEEEPEHFIHPFADATLMVGHGGIGLELLEQVPGLRRVVVPVGGGGLISGVAAALKSHEPSIEVVGAQSDGYALWPHALAAGGAVPITPATIADGTTAPYDASMHDLLRAHVDRWVVVPELRLRGAVAELPARAKVVAEGAGALAFAALEQLEAGPLTAAVVSGGNIDPGLLGHLLLDSPRGV
jgi:threonine dehydratase